jgi:hypothetical protein
LYTYNVPHRRANHTSELITMLRPHQNVLLQEYVLHLKVDLLCYIIYILLRDYFFYLLIYARVITSLAIVSIAPLSRLATLSARTLLCLLSITTRYKLF